MPVTLDPTVGGVNANTYVSLADADTYMESIADSTTWDAAEDDDKNRALVTATRLLDAKVIWAGTVATDTQRLLWPRDDVYGRNGYVLPSNALPEELKQATAEYANALIEAAAGEDVDVPAGVKRFKAGPVEFEFSDAAAAVSDGRLPSVVWDLIRHLGRQARGISVPLVRT